MRLCLPITDFNYLLEFVFNLKQNTQKRKKTDKNFNVLFAHLFSPSLSACQAAHEDCHRLVRAPGLHRVVGALRSFALAADELATGIRV